MLFSSRPPSDGTHSPHKQASLESICSHNSGLLTLIAAHYCPLESRLTHTHKNTQRCCICYLANHSKRFKKVGGHLHAHTHAHTHTLIHTHTIQSSPVVQGELNAGGLIGKGDAVREYSWWTKQMTRRQGNPSLWIWFLCGSFFIVIITTIMRHRTMYRFQKFIWQLHQEDTGQ